MPKVSSHRAFILSTLFHFAVLFCLIVSYMVARPKIVLSNHDTKIVNAIALKENSLIAPPTKVLEDKTKMEPSLVKTEIPTPSLLEPKKEKLATVTPAAEPKKIATLPKKLAVKATTTPKQLLDDLESEISKQEKTHQHVMKKKFAKELRAQSAKALKQLMTETNAQVSQKRAQDMDGVIDKYKGLILKSIAQQWVVPSHVSKSLYCELMIRLSPGGLVLDVQIIKGSGDVLLDKSARAAIFKASPLPVPEDIYSFEPFRQFVLRVKPENVVET